LLLDSFTLKVAKVWPPDKLRISYILGGDRAVGYEVVFNVVDEVLYVGATNSTLY
jgi:hypothetical protein